MRFEDLRVGQIVSVGVEGVGGRWVVIDKVGSGRHAFVTLERQVPVQLAIPSSEVGGLKLLREPPREEVSS